MHIYLILGLALAACKKTENRELPLPDSNRNAKLTSIPFASCKPNIIPKSRLYENCRDEKERQIDQKHYQMMEELLPYANEKAFKQLLSKSKNRENKTIYLREINQTITAVKSGLKTETSFPEDCSTEYEGYHYKDVVFVPNADWANFELSPIYSPGIELYDDISDQDEEEGNHDVIFGWYVDENGDTIEINIGEADCAQTTRPIIVAGLETCEEVTENLPKLFNGLLESKKQISNRGSFTPLINGLQINYRYDNSNMSEVNCHFIKFTSSLFEKNGRFRVKEVNKKNINSFLSVSDVSFSDGNFVATLKDDFSDRLCYNLFEYDWYAGSKNLGSCQAPSGGTSFSLDRANMKFSNEWYAFDPVNSLNSKAVPASSITSNGFEISFEQNKGKIKIKK